MSETRQPRNEHDQDDSRPDHRTCMWQDLTKLVPPVPQDEVQKREGNEWDEPERHANMVQLCTAIPAKEGRSDEKLNEASKTTGDRERVTDLGSLEIKGGSDEYLGAFEIRYAR